MTHSPDNLDMAVPLRRRFLAVMGQPWLPVLLLFLVVRLFSAYPYVSLSGDQCKYLALADSFPHHHLYNQSLYLIHQPLYGAVVGLIACVLPSYLSGLLVSGVFAVLNLYAIRRFAIACGLSVIGITAALAYVTINEVAVAFDSHVSRTGMLMFFMAMALATWQEFLNRGGEGVPWQTLLFSGLAMSTSDQALFVLPCQAVLMVAHPSRRQAVRAGGILAVVSGIIYSVWPLVRWTYYRRHEYYPAGIDGTIEQVSAFTLKCLLQPNFFPLTHFHRGYFTTTSFSWRNFQWSNSLTVPADLILVPDRLASVGIGVVVVVALVRAWQGRDALLPSLLTIAICLYWPCFFGMNRWYGLGFMIPFSVIVGYAVSGRSGLSSATAVVATPGRCERRWLLWCAWSVALVSAVLWLNQGPGQRNSVFEPRGGKHFLWTRTPLTRGSEPARELPGDATTGFMAPVGLVPEMVYLTGGRWVALPFEPEMVDIHIRRYSIDYVLLSSRYFHGRPDDGWNRAASRTAARYIHQHPARFERVGEWLQRYPDCYSDEAFYLYRVVQ